MEIKYFEDENRSIAYYICGKKDSDETILFLNGLYVGNKSWIKQQRYSYFKNNYKMIFIDYPGVGESIEKADIVIHMDDIVEIIKTILNKEKCKTCNLIGYSVGGMISFRFIHKYPQYVKKLILLNTGVDIDIDMENRIRSVVKALAGQDDIREIFRKAYPLNHSKSYLEKVSNIEQQVVNVYVTYNKNRIALSRFLRSVGDRPDLRPVLKEINIPVLIIGSDEDQIFTYKFQKQLFDNIANNEYYSIKGCGHSSYIEKYEEVNNLIEKFLRKHND